MEKLNSFTVVDSLGEVHTVAAHYMQLEGEYVVFYISENDNENTVAIIFHRPPYSRQDA